MMAPDKNERIFRTSNGGNRTGLVVCQHDGVSCAWGGPGTTPTRSLTPRLVSILTPRSASTSSGRVIIPVLTTSSLTSSTTSSSSGACQSSELRFSGRVRPPTLVEPLVQDVWLADCRHRRHRLRGASAPVSIICCFENLFKVGVVELIL